MAFVPFLSVQLSVHSGTRNAYIKHHAYIKRQQHARQRRHQCCLLSSPSAIANPPSEIRCSPFSMAERAFCRDALSLASFCWIFAAGTGPRSGPPGSRADDLVRRWAGGWAVDRDAVHHAHPRLRQGLRRRQGASRPTRGLKHSLVRRCIDFHLKAVQDAHRTTETLLAEIAAVAH
eukprot:6211757-Pleurochrysis_carterae.AAC.4